METDRAARMPLSERHPFWAMAGLLKGRFGHQAHIHAEAYARLAERQGDRDAKAIWTEVAGALRPHAGKTDYPLSPKTVDKSVERPVTAP